MKIQPKTIWNGYKNVLSKIFVENSSLKINRKYLVPILILEKINSVS